MTKIVYNGCYGGFSLSNTALRRYSELSGYGIKQEGEYVNLVDKNDEYVYISDMRDDPILVQVVEELGEAANGDCAELYIVEIPAGTRYRIDEYDGNERVMTIEDYDWKIA
jgi:hypothetical protein